MVWYVHGIQHQRNVFVHSPNIIRVFHRYPLIVMVHYWLLLHPIVMRRVRRSKNDDDDEKISNYHLVIHQIRSLLGPWKMLIFEAEISIILNYNIQWNLYHSIRILF